MAHHEDKQFRVYVTNPNPDQLDLYLVLGRSGVRHYMFSMPFSA